MSGHEAERATRYWDHREARMIDRRRTGFGSPAARAAAERAASAADAEAFWEPHYARTRAGGGGPNPVLVDVAEAMAPGRALDLGCGPGGDSLWLARRGWVVTSVDVSTSALRRVAALAVDQGVSERVRVDRHDLSATFPDGVFDLVNVHYLHSPVALDRPAVLARAAAAVAPGGMLLVVDHASVAPWSWTDPHTVFPTPQQTLDGIGLDLSTWDVVTAEDRDRRAEGPDGLHATVTDTVIALVRRPPVTR